MNHDLFDLGEDYDAMLAQGLRLSGEDKRYFIRGRLRKLRESLPPPFSPRRILDFGCGTGDAARELADAFPGARVLGLEASENMLAHARRMHPGGALSFAAIRDFQETGVFDLCHVNGVFHHIAPAGRLKAAAALCRFLAPGGRLAFFENNPWNPGTRWVMSRIPFDRDAKPLSPPEARSLLREAGFADPAPTLFLFYFPRPLAFLRFSEPWLERLPLGAQYFILAAKP